MPSEQHDRLRTAREQAGFASPTDAARAFGWNEVTYRSHENGTRGLRPDAAEKYARAFRVNLSWLLTGEGERAKKNIVRVTGYVGAGAEVHPTDEQIPGDGLEEIEVSFPLPDGTEALIIRGDSNYPRFQDGEAICFFTRVLEPEEMIGQECIILAEDGRRLVKKLRRGSGPGLYTLESYNAPAEEDVRVRGVCEIQATIRARHWRRLKRQNGRTKLAQEC